MNLRRPPLTRRALVGGITQLLGGMFVAAVILAAAGFALFTPRVGAGTARQMASRELALALEPGETVERSAVVSQRHWWRYFHPTYGVLAYTDKRVVWVGAEPRALIEWDADEPAAFEMKTWAHDSVAIRPVRFLFGLVRGVALLEPGRRGRRELFDVAPAQWDALGQVTATLERRQAFLRAEAERERQRQALQGWVVRLPVYHAVRPGEAVSSIAAAYGLTPDSLRALNALIGDRIRAGQLLLVKPRL
jgi:hypothetical protein